MRGRNASTAPATLTGIVLLAMLAGCAAYPPALEQREQSVELTAVPFFPQTQYQCGPAALATVLADAGLAVDAGMLTPQVYVEGLRGTLQPELLAATRRHGLIPYRIDAGSDGGVGSGTGAGGADTLLAELDAGRPVLVLQNLGLARWPVWHYAVVVGFDVASDRFVLRSGTERRRLERPRAFMRRWSGADHWGFVALSPGELPAGATPEHYVRALADAEVWLDAEAAAAAHTAAVDAWPAHPLVLFAAATRDLADGRLVQAEQRYRRLLAQQPSNVAARNNLAHALVGQGNCTAAQQEARRALELAAGEPALAGAVGDTLDELQAAAATGSCGR